MSMIIYSVGLDVDKISFKACLKFKEEKKASLIKATRTFSNSVQGFKEFHQWLQKHNQPLQASLTITLEATGVYHENLAWYLHSLNYVIHIVLPSRAKHYMKSLGLKSKNDKIDASGLADMGLQQELTPWIPCSENIMALRGLTRQVEMFQESRTILINQLEAAQHQAFSDKLIIKNLKTHIHALERDIVKLKKRITEAIQEDPVLASKYELVKPLKGLGMLTFATLVAETGGFQLFKNQKQLTSYAGYDVIENQSGARVGKTRISKQGNTHIRRIMFMASFNMVRFQVHPFLHLYQRVEERTKIKMKGYVAVQRKLLCLTYTLWKKHVAFDPKYQLPKNKVAAAEAAATLDERPAKPEVLFEY